MATPHSLDKYIPVLNFRTRRDESLQTPRFKMQVKAKETVKLKGNRIGHPKICHFGTWISLS